MDQKVRHKISTAIESGFRCGKCGWETVTFDGSAPTTCSNCGHPAPKLVWKNKITNQVTAEILPLT